MDPEGGREDSELAGSSQDTFSFPAQTCTPFPRPTPVWSVEAGRGLGIGLWGLGDIWGLGINKTSSGSGRVPGCTEEGAGLSLRAQRHLQETRQLHFELQVKQGEEFQTTWQGKVGDGQGL